MIDGLLKFVPPNFSKDAAVLVVESAKYLEGLRSLMPASKIALLTTEKTPRLVETCQKFHVDLMTGGLPTAPKIFDVIIAEEVLSVGEDFYVRLLELNHLLKDSGFLLTKFLNVRFIGVLEGLRRGEFPAQKKFWAKWDVVKILDGAVFKEIRFLPGAQIEVSTAEWESFGFDNFSSDLATKIWLVKACKCTAEVVALKEVYTPEIRAELSRLLHRIEYGIDVDENLSALLELCERAGIFADYLQDFVGQVVVHSAAADFIKRVAIDKLA